MIYADATDDLNSVIDGAGPIAGVFFLFLGIAIFVIWKSMNRQIKKINPDLPPGRADRLRMADEKYTAEAEARGAEEQRDETQAAAKRGAEDAASAHSEEQPPANG